jgi:hypothetical protein
MDGVIDGVLVIDGVIDGVLVNVGVMVGDGNNAFNSYVLLYKSKYSSYVPYGYSELYSNGNVFSPKLMVPPVYGKKVTLVVSPLKLLLDILIPEGIS